MQTVFIHHSFYPFMQTIARFEVRVSAYTLNDHISSCHLIWWQRGNMQEKHTVQMVQAHESGSRSQWVGEVCWQSEIHYLKYYFELIDNENRIFFADEYGISENQGTEQTAFELLQTHNENIISVPEWAKGCVFYQIYPDSFSLPPEASDSEKENWNSKPDKDHYLGGTLRGILSRIPYLKDLGVECLYLTPIFQADFTHRYATTDYLKIDPRLGTERDLIDLTEALHDNGIRIVLDGVFNHCGVHFAPFEDVLKNGEKSPYKDWFHIKKYPVTIDPSCYECVGDYSLMPRLNGACPEVRKYVKSVLLYWLKTAQIDGWRFDVADELDENAVRYWCECVRRKYPEALMLAETWHPGTLISDGCSHFDCAMNYLFRSAMLDYFAHDTIDENTFISRIEDMLMCYPEDINDAMYNLVGSHDTPRFLTECRNEKWRVKMAAAFQMLFRGSPAIYYGDEIGMVGENDPGCRAGTTWNHMDPDLLNWVKYLISIRKTHPAVIKGKCSLSVRSDGCLVLERTLDSDRVTAVFNKVSVNSADAAGKVDVPARSVKIIFSTLE